MTEKAKKYLADILQAIELIEDFSLYHKRLKIFLSNLVLAIATCIYYNYFMKTQKLLFDSLKKLFYCTASSVGSGNNNSPLVNHDIPNANKAIHSSQKTIL